MKLIANLFLGMLIASGFAACKSGGDYQGLEFAPNMYHSVAYEPLTQITDKDAGWYFNSLDNGRGEFYNSNQYNPYAMNMRLPVSNTVKRNELNWLPYRGANDAEGMLLAHKMKSPLDTSVAIVGQGQVLYEIYCKHCHGIKGAGNGTVAEGVKIDGVDHSSFPGVANLTGEAFKNITEGHIFHVITYGKGLMGAHGSQVSEAERWKIARYVKHLQKN